MPFVDNPKVALVQSSAETRRIMSSMRIVNPLGSDAAFVYAPVCYTKSKFCRKIGLISVDRAFSNLTEGSLEICVIPVWVLVKMFSVRHLLEPDLPYRESEYPPAGEIGRFSNSAGKKSLRSPKL